MELFHKMISGSLGIPERQIASTLHLLGEGATIPFISRYRKEATGGLDEVQIEQIKEPGSAVPGGRAHAASAIRGPRQHRRRGHPGGAGRPAAS